MFDNFISNSIEMFESPLLQGIDNEKVGESGWK